MEKKQERTSFFKNHSDTVAIIGVNIAIAAILLSICLSNISSIAATNARSDQLSSNILTLMQEIKDMHGRVCVVEAKTGGK